MEKKNNPDNIYVTYMATYHAYDKNLGSVLNKQILGPVKKLCH